jgi:hypothetical protein
MLPALATLVGCRIYEASVATFLPRALLERFSQLSSNFLEERQPPTEKRFTQNTQNTRKATLGIRRTPRRGAKGRIESRCEPIRVIVGSHHASIRPS